MHPPHVRAEALALVDQGLNDCEISRRLGIPRRTILDWRRPTYVPRNGRPRLPESCPRCWRAAKPMRFAPEDYAEILAIYLGDGCISEGARTSRLRIALDTKYPGIIADSQALLRRCFPENPVGEVIAHGGTMVFVSLYSSHLPCLFPQHGPGLKHQRAIVLEPWQQEIVEAAPWPFIRGCIRTDGCSFINRTGPYEYLSYDFSNSSRDIVELFVGACDLVDVEYRVSHSRIWRVRINRRASVALLLEHVGLKE
ncbi:MAG: helix-turn-helix domain-containing protein [Solirubrobacterales bacterium]